jgi:uncharacterized protein HemY
MALSIRQIKKMEIESKKRIELLNQAAYCKRYGRVVNSATILTSLLEQPDSERNTPEIRKQYSQRLLACLDEFEAKVPKEIRDELIGDIMSSVTRDYCQIVINYQRPAEVEPELTYLIRCYAPN